MWKVKGNKGPLLRAITVVSSVGILVTGVTFASLQSQQAILTGNSIQSATADLRIGTSISTFSSSRTGFSFTNVIPGGPAMPTDGNTFYLKNYGTANLALKLTIGSTPTNTGSIDLTKVSVQLTRTDIVNSTPQTATLQSLLDPNGGLTLGDSLAAGATAQYSLRIAMAADAFSGSTASIGSIDFVFSGTAATQ